MDIFNGERDIPDGAPACLQCFIRRRARFFQAGLS
jgi:hypothetical protein